MRAIRITKRQLTNCCRGTAFALTILASLPLLTGCGSGSFAPPVGSAGAVSGPTVPTANSLVISAQNPVYSSASEQDVGAGNAWENQSVGFSQMDARAYKYLVLHILTATSGLKIGVNVLGVSLNVLPSGKDGYVQVPQGLAGSAQDVIIPISAFTDAGGDLSQVSDVRIEYGQAYNYIPTGGQKDRLNPNNTGQLVLDSVEFTTSAPGKANSVPQIYVPEQQRVQTGRRWRDRLGQEDS